MTHKIDPVLLRNLLVKVGSIEAAADQLGISSRTITRRRKTDPVVRAAIEAGQREHRIATFPHGTASGYRMRCRCEACTIAHRLQHQESKAARAKRLDEATHGVPSTYTNWMCRCGPCVKAHSDDLKARYWEGKR